jgi:hypothetical protein
MLQKLPAGIIPDAAADFSWFGLQSNANAYCGQLTSAATSGTAYALPTTILPGVLRLTSGASGGFTITLPTTQQIISALGPTIPTDGSYGQPFSIVNDGIGQTGTVTAGDASTTLTGTMTIATNTRRDFFITVNSPTTITVQNCGSATL